MIRITQLHRSQTSCLSAETVQSAALSLQGVHHVQRSHRLAASVLSVRHRVADHVLQEHLQHTAGLLVDQTGDALHASSARQTTDRGLGDALDVVSEDLAMALSAALAETLSSLSSASHCVSWLLLVVKLKETLICVGCVVLGWGASLNFWPSGRRSGECTAGVQQRTADLAGRKIAEPPHRETVN